MRERLRSGALGYLVAVVVAAVAVAIRRLLDPWLGDQLPLITLFAAVAAAVWFGGYRSALLAAVLGYIACSYLFIEPRGGFGLYSVPHLVGALAYFVSCSVLIAFGEAMRAAQIRTGERQELLRITLASIGDAVITTDTAGRVAFANPVAESLTGWTQDQAAGQPLDAVFRIVNEESREPVENPAEKVLREGRIVGLANHTVLIGKDGTERPIDDSASPIRDEHGRLAGCVLVFRDVTERRRAEQALARSEQELRDFFDNAAVGLHWVGPDGSVLRVNQTELEMLGYERDEYVGRNIGEFHADADVIADILRRLSAGETLTNYPARLRHKDGSFKHALISSNVLWEGGTFIHTRCFTRDVTEQKRIEQELREAHAASRKHSQELQTIYDTTPVGMCLIDRDLRYVRINERLAEMNGVPAADHIGRTVREMVPDLADHIEPAFLRVMETGTAVTEIELIGETKALPGVKRIWLESWYPQRDEQGDVVGVNVVAQEITDRKRSEEALRDADRRKDEFLATLAHELRNPLTPVRNSLEVMKRAEGNADLLEQARGTMERQVSQMERLIDDLLDISRITRDRLELRKQPVELASVVHHAVEACRPLAEASRHEVSVTLPPEPIYLEGDPVRLAQVFGNLLNNACKYTKPGGRIGIAAHRQQGDVIVSVKDSGIGIPPRMLPRIFEMFIQVDRTLERSQGGLGIGLTLVKQLVEMHDGHVEALSDGPGLGSEFVVRLPVLVGKPEGHHLQKPSTGEAAVMPRRRILVVDDNTDSAESLATLFELMGHETRLAHDGLAAVDAAEQFRPDVVLLDIGLPKLNGFDACRRIREQPWGKHMLVVALTGWGQDQDRRNSRDAGFDDHMVKPVDHASLMKLLASLPSERGQPGAA